MTAAVEDLVATPFPQSRHGESYRSTTTFASPPRAVFDALTCAAAVARWWAPVTGSGSAGGRLSAMFGDQELRIRVDRADAPTHVGWTVLVSVPLPDWEATTMTFDISAVDGGSMLQFTHTGLTPALGCFTDCKAGWIQYMASLVDYVDNAGGTAFGSAEDERAAKWANRRDETST